MRATRERFPALADLDWDHAWCGPIDVTLDQLPRLCRLAPGMWSVLGHNGRGIAMATTMGAVVANQILGGRDDTLRYPVTELKQVPFHWLRAPAIAAGIAYYRIKDSLGFAS